MNDINWSPTYANNFILTSNQIGIFEPAAIAPGDFWCKSISRSSTLINLAEMGQIFGILLIGVMIYHKI